MVHFFVIGALLFLIHAMLARNPRTIVITPGLTAELARRFRDLNGRRPEPSELAAALRQWERDEALFREALREHLDRDDPGVRAALVDKMHARAAFEVPEREPTDAELAAWLDSHRGQYETPLRYDFEFLAFPKASPDAGERLERAERAIDGGANPSTLGPALIGGDLSLLDMKERIDPELAERIPSLEPERWQRIESERSFFLARVKHVDGGLPSLEALRPRLRSDWSFWNRERAIERVLQKSIDRYHFERRP